MYKNALPIVELCALEARQGNPLLLAAMKKDENLLLQYRGLEKIAQNSKSGINKLISEFLAGLASNDKTIQSILSNKILDE